MNVPPSKFSTSSAEVQSAITSAPFETVSNRNVSAPAPPVIVSEPALDMIVSAAAPPSMLSAAPEPVMVSSAAEPVIVLPSPTPEASIVMLSVPLAK